MEREQEDTKREMMIDVDKKDGPGVEYFGPYRVLGPLGRGGMGIVYKGVDSRSGQPVALKTIRLSNMKLLDSIRREIRALARLDHPGIVRIIDHGDRDGFPWYAMELLEGQTLRHYSALCSRSTLRASNQKPPGPAHDPDCDPAVMTQTCSEMAMTETNVTVDYVRGHPEAGQKADQSECLSGADGHIPVTPKDVTPQRSDSISHVRSVLTIIRRICNPLAYLHGEGIVHRDLKPDNIIIRADGMPVLVDFGLVIHVRGEVNRETISLDQGGSGTVCYMAPEQILGNLTDPRTDLYALGCILYELLTGNPPFHSITLSEIVQSHLRAQPQSLTAYLPGIPVALNDLVERLLAKDATRRIGYAADVASILASFGAENGWSSSGPKARPYLYKARFTGRTEHLEQLEGYLSDITHNRGGMVMVSGESGVGKTRLVQEFALQAQKMKITVLVGECSAEHKQPLDAFRRPLQMLADQCRERGVAETDRLFGKRGKLLAGYEPSLDGLPGQDNYPEPAYLPSAQARSRLFNYLWQTFQILTADGPILFVLDDLQWADDLTLGFLSFLIRHDHLSHIPLLIIGTIRLDEIPDELIIIRNDARVKCHDLDRMNYAAVGSMVGDMLAMPQVPEVFCSFLLQWTGGNPFFIAEFLRAAVEQGQLWRDQNGHWQIRQTREKTLSITDFEQLHLPASVVELVDTRLKALSEKHKLITALSAVYGREIPLPLLSELADMSVNDLDDCIRELEQRHIMVRSSHETLDFSHTTMRNVSYERIPAQLKVSYHNRVADEIERSYPLKLDEYYAALGHHWEMAAHSEKARTYYLQAAHHMAKQYAYGEAERLFRHSLRLSDAPSECSVKTRNALAGTVLQVQGRNNEALAEHQRALEEALELGNQLLQAQTMVNLGTTSWYLGKNKEAQSFFKQAIAIFQDLGERELLGPVIMNMAVMLRDLEGPQEALNMLKQSLIILEAAQNKAGMAKTLANMAIVSRDLDDLEAATTYSNQALELYRELGDRHGEGITLINLVAVPLDQGQIHEALELCQQALKVIKTVGNPRAEGLALNSLAVMKTDLGEPLEAYELFQQALGLFQEIGEIRWTAYVLKGISLITRLVFADYDRVDLLLNEAISILETMNDTFELVNCHCQRGFNALARGQNASDQIALIEQLLATTKITTINYSGRLLEKLKNSNELFLTGHHHLLFRGESLQYINHPFRQWLAKAGHLSEDQLQLCQKFDPANDQEQ
ncbi:tetratricopeptide repeat protein [bacterium]|nr:tetratricopeptide repeat protein [bacterium]